MNIKSDIIFYNKDIPMKKSFKINYSSYLVATILSISAMGITACSETEIKAVDRVEEAEALARVKSLESQAAAIKEAPERL